MTRVRTLHALLGFEVVLYFLPSLMHRGLLLADHRRPQAAIAEAVIAAVLFVGLLAALLRPSHLRTIGLTAQMFALLGTLVGAVMIALGVGPQTTLDLVIHTIMLATLLLGVVLFWRHREG